MNYFAGLDWGSVEHAACVIDQEGAVVARLDVQHTAEGLRKLPCDLARIAPPEEIPVAIERPSGVVVDTLVDAGHPLVPVHPNALKASRPRYRAAGGKSDPGDAYILADLLRTDGHRFRALSPASDEIRALRAAVRTRDDLVAERVALANQLRALLESFWPGAAVIFAPSPRKTDPSRVREIVRHLPPGVFKVGVFVNEDLRIVEQIAGECDLDFLQLHGEESPEYCRRAPLPVAASSRISPPEPVAAPAKGDIAVG